MSNHVADDDLTDAPSESPSAPLFVDAEYDDDIPTAVATSLSVPFFFQHASSATNIAVARVPIAMALDDDDRTCCAVATLEKAGCDFFPIHTQGQHRVSLVIEFSREENVVMEHWATMGAGEET